MTWPTHLKKETPRNDPFQAWKAAFKKAVTDKIVSLRSEGVCAIGLECFFRGVKIPTGAPKGSTARYVIKQELRAIIASLPKPDQKFFLN